MIVVIKQKLTPYTIGQDKNKVAQTNTLFGSEQNGRLKKHANNGRFITGYELPIGVSREEVLKDKKNSYYELIKELSEIETDLGLSLDNHKDNEFLLNLVIKLADKSGKDITLNLVNSLDKFIYKAAIANGLIAPSKEELTSRKYLKTDYYFTKPEKEESNRKLTSKIKNQIGSKLTHYENNKIWLLAVSVKLGLHAGSESSVDNLYSQIDAYKNEITSQLEAEKVLKIVNSTPEDLEFDFIITVASKRGDIKGTKETGKIIDGVKVGDTIEDVRDNLKLDGFIEQYQFIRKKVYSNYGIK